MNIAILYSKIAILGFGLINLDNIKETKTIKSPKILINIFSRALSKTSYTLLTGENIKSPYTAIAKYRE